MENCFSSGEGPTSSANTSAMSTSNSSGVALYSGHDGLTFRILSYCTQLTLTIDLSMQVLIKLWENGDLQSMHGFANARRLVSPVLWSRYHRHSQRPTRLAPEMIESFRSNCGQFLQSLLSYFISSFQRQCDSHAGRSAQSLSTVQLTAKVECLICLAFLIKAFRRSLETGTMKNDEIWLRGF